MTSKGPGPSAAEVRAMEAYDIFERVLGRDRRLAAQLSYELASVAERYEKGNPMPLSYSALAHGGAVKAVGTNRLRGLGVVYGGRDLVGDTFTKATDLGASRSYIGMPVYYDHGLSTVKSQVGQVTAFEFTDDGLEFELELDKRKSYIETINKLVAEGALGLSTGALGHLVVSENGFFRRWIIGELSLTPTPAEPRTSVTAKRTPATDALVDLIEYGVRKQLEQSERDKHIEDYVRSRARNVGIGRHK